MIKLNGFEVIFKKFPNGEILIDGDKMLHITKHDRNNVVFKYENDSDLIKLMFVKKHLDELVEKYTALELKIVYMPYSRMDRIEGTSVFTLKYVGEFINQLKFDSVEIVEPHSDVCMALIDRSKATYPTVDIVLELIKNIKFEKDNDYLLFPDTGAAKRYANMFNGYRHLVGHKVRDFETGKITRLDILGDTGNNFKTIIVDDLCSGGYTFYLAAQKLEEMNCNEVHLVTAHCEEKIYDGLLLDQKIVKSINTTNSIISESKHKKINVLPII